MPRRETLASTSQAYRIVAHLYETPKATEEGVAQALGLKLAAIRTYLKRLKKARLVQDDTWGGKSIIRLSDIGRSVFKTRPDELNEYELSDADERVLRTLQSAEKPLTPRTTMRGRSAGPKLFCQTLNRTVKYKFEFSV
jgi:transcription initiation factor IIE alpha subunit